MIKQKTHYYNVLMRRNLNTFIKKVKMELNSIILTVIY